MRPLLTGALTVGIAMLMISGEFDLSVGSLMAVGGYLYGGLSMAGQPVLGLFLAILVPALLGAINGLILVWTGIPSFIVTLGTKYLYRGLLWVITAGTMLQTVDRLPIYNLFNGRFDFLTNLFPEQISAILDLVDFIGCDISNDPLEDRLATMFLRLVEMPARRWDRVLMSKK